MNICTEHVSISDCQISYSIPDKLKKKKKKTEKEGKKGKEKKKLYTLPAPLVSVTNSYKDYGVLMSFCTNGTYFNNCYLHFQL